MTKRERQLIKAGAVIIGFTLIITVVAVLVSQHMSPEVTMEKPVDPSSQNLKSLGIALTIYCPDGGMFPSDVLPDSKITGSEITDSDSVTTNEINTDTEADNKKGDQNLVP